LKEAEKALISRNHSEVYIAAYSSKVTYYTNEKRGYKLARESKKGIGADYDAILRHLTPRGYSCCTLLWK
jgi:hypothetical protein